MTHTHVYDRATQVVQVGTRWRRNMTRTDRSLNAHNEANTESKRPPSEWWLSNFQELTNWTIALVFSGQFEAAIMKPRFLFLRHLVLYVKLLYTLHDSWVYFEISEIDIHRRTTVELGTSNYSRYSYNKIFFLLQNYMYASISWCSLCIFSTQ